MSDIFREVDEALQQEKLAKVWKNYGPVIVIAIIVMIVATAAGTAYKTWNSSENRKETGELITAAEDKDAAAALEKAAADTRDGHKAVALMNAAAKHAEKKEFAKAAAMYDDLSRDGSAPSELRDLANILYVRSMLLTPDAKPEHKALLDRLLPVAKGKSPFQLQARLDAATLYGDLLKDYTQALAMLEGFDADSTTDSLKEKANALKHVYTYELTQQPAAAKQ
jgi:hypothetical protein